MTRALGEDKAQSVLSRITRPHDRLIEILDWMDARSIAELIIDEHPQIIALVISYLDYGLGADVLGQLPEATQADVIGRIATLQTVQPDALRELENVMQRKFQANTSLRASQVGGVKAAAKIMNFTKQAMEARIMGALKEDDEDLMVAIQESMFVFDNLIMSMTSRSRHCCVAPIPRILFWRLKVLMNRCVKSCSAVCHHVRQPICRMKWRPLVRYA